MLSAANYMHVCCTQQNQFNYDETKVGLHTVGRDMRQRNQIGDEWLLKKFGTAIYGSWSSVQLAREP